MTCQNEQNSAGSLHWATVSNNEKTVKILIVDDSILIRRSLIKLIDQIDGNLEIAEAVNVPEGIRMAKEILPDIIILDIMMPGGTGFNVLKIVTEFDVPPVTIVLSKYSTNKFRKEAVEGGADHFFDKSTEFEKVIKVIKEYKN